jgi:hypothetical protein
VTQLATNSQLCSTKAGQQKGLQRLLLSCLAVLWTLKPTQQTEFLGCFPSRCSDFSKVATPGDPYEILAPYPSSQPTKKNISQACDGVQSSYFAELKSLGT